VKVAGCTVHFVDEHLDHGPIILQKTVPVMEDDDAHSLAERILKQEHIAYSEGIQLVLSGTVRVEGRKIIKVNSRVEGH
jgi:phosphoribosylglycinamide formyltransferase 1